MREDVRRGLLAPERSLPSKYFYDARGSKLFDAITHLPEYYPTRAERLILERGAPAIVREVTPSTLVELGAGSADKTRLLLDAMTSGRRQATYVPVDVSAQHLHRTAAVLRTDYPTLDVRPVVADISAAVALPVHPLPTLHAFLGSTIGNFADDDAAALLGRAAERMTGGDAFLLGADLRKDPAIIERAYNDPRGVTAEFNRNVLHVLNRALGADFEPARFRHRAVYSVVRHRLEMYLDAMDEQTVLIPGVGTLHFRRGDSILTEVSHKYDRDAIAELLARGGLTLVRWDTDDAGLFSLALARLAA